MESNKDPKLGPKVERGREQGEKARARGRGAGGSRGAAAPGMSTRRESGQREARTYRFGVLLPLQEGRKLQHPELGAGHAAALPRGCWGRGGRRGGSCGRLEPCTQWKAHGSRSTGPPCRTLCQAPGLSALSGSPSRGGGQAEHWPAVQGQPWQGAQPGTAQPPRAPARNCVQGGLDAGWGWGVGWLLDPGLPGQPPLGSCPGETPGPARETTGLCPEGTRKPLTDSKLEAAR